MGHSYLILQVRNLLGTDPDKVRVASLSFSSRSQSENLDQSPTDFELVGSDNCEDWTSISSFQTQFTKVSEVQSWDVAVDERKAFRCVGIKVNKVGSGRFAAIQGLKMYAESDGNECAANSHNCDLSAHCFIT